MLTTSEGNEQQPQDEMDMDAPPVDPTPQEWENVIIPGLRRYLQNENHPLYEIDVRTYVVNDECRG